MASTYLTRTAGTPTNAKKFTISFWSKRTKLSADQQILGFETDSNNKLFCWFNGSDQFDFINKSSNSTTMRLKTTRVFRDPSAWYHIVLAVDTTDSTSTDRLKLYVNGSRQLSANNGYASETYPSADATASVGGTHIIGADHNGGSQQYFYDGILTHVHYTDGYVYTPSTFGETDSTSGIWKPKTSPSVTYGTNGYFLKFENSGAMGTDSSGNTNTFTPAGTLTQNIDTPTNSFCIFNRLDRWLGTTNNYGDYLSKGNNTVTMASSNKGLVRGTLGVESGKWYWEAQANSVSKGFYGMTNELAFNTSSAPHDSTNKAGVWYYEGVPDFRYYSGAGEITTDAVSISADDILMFALDMDNKSFYIGKNGTWMASGDPTSGSSKTGAISEKFANPTAWADSGPVFPAVYVSSTSGTIDADYNFGSGFFGTTAVASANADGNGFGAFEYAVPSGYYALCTKNIKEFG